MTPTKSDIPGVECFGDSDGDYYFGRPDALIAAGLVGPDQLPGNAGMPRTSVMFVKGIQQPRTARPPHNQDWMQVAKIGRAFRVTKGVTGEERERREQTEEDEREARSRIKHDPGLSAAHEAVRDASALFKVGDSVTVAGCAAVISQGYGVHRTKEKGGEYLQDDGSRSSYRLGYIIQFRNGETYFVEAWKVTDPEGAPTHLQLVGVPSVRTQRPMIALGG